MYSLPICGFYVFIPHCYPTMSLPITKKSHQELGPKVVWNTISVQDLKDVFPAPRGKYKLGFKPQEKVSDGMKSVGANRSEERKMENIAFYDETMKIIKRNTVEWWKARCNQDEVAQLMQTTGHGNPWQRSGYKMPWWFSFGP
jgi:hypothetical protein